MSPPGLYSLSTDEDGPALTQHGDHVDAEHSVRYAPMTRESS